MRQARGRRRRGRRASRAWSPRAPGRRAGPGAAGGLPSRSPALEPPVSAPISTSGWASSSRRTSPPAYPLAPATATEYGHVHDYTDSCMLSDNPGAAGRWPARRLARMTTLAPERYLDHIRTESRGSATCWPTATPPHGSPAAPTGTPPTCSSILPGCSTSGPPSSGSGPTVPRSSRSRASGDVRRAARVLRRVLRRAGRGPRGGRPGRARVELGARADRRLHLPPAGPRGADPPARRRAGRRPGDPLDPGLAADGVAGDPRHDVRRHAALGRVHARRRTGPLRPRATPGSRS